MIELDSVDDRRLADGLSELAAGAALMAGLRPAQAIRARGTRRRVRRIAATVTVIVAVPVLGVGAVHAATEAHRTPSRPALITPVAARRAVLDTARRTLSVGRDTGSRTFPVSAGSPENPVPVGTLRIAKLWPTHRMTQPGPDAFDVVIDRVMELSGANGYTTYLFAAPWDNLDGTDDANRAGNIHLRPADATWFYQHSRLGDTIQIH